MTHIGRKNVKSLTAFTQTIFHSLKVITKVGADITTVTMENSVEIP